MHYWHETQKLSVVACYVCACKVHGSGVLPYCVINNNYLRFFTHAQTFSQISKGVGVEYFGELYEPE